MEPFLDIKMIFLKKIYWKDFAHHINGGGI